MSRKRREVEDEDIDIPTKFDEDIDEIEESEYIMGILKQKRLHSASFLGAQSKAIMRDSITTFLSSRTRELRMKKYLKPQPPPISSIPSSTHTAPNDFILKCFNTLYDLSTKGTNYHEALMSNPNAYTCEEIPRVTYADVKDYFREPISHLVIGPDVAPNLRELYSQLNASEKFCKLNERCWANKLVEDGGGGFGIVLRGFMHFGVCICCIRDAVNKMFKKNKANGYYKAVVVQDLNYVVDEDPVLDHKNKTEIFNYCSKYMLYQEEDEPYLGLFGSYPSHSRSRFKNKLTRVM